MRNILTTENWGTILSKLLGFIMAAVMAVQAYTGVTPDMKVEGSAAAFILLLAAILHWHAVASTVPLTEVADAAAGVNATGKVGAAS